MKDKMKRLAENILKSEQGLVGAARAANPIRNLPGIIKVEIAKKIAEKPKKMNMGGVVPGRGGSFKGTR
jgi:hypothetical protein